MPGSGLLPVDHKSDSVISIRNPTDGLKPIPRGA